MTIGTDKGKQPEIDEWVRKAAEKEIDFDLNHAKETFLEEKNNSTEASTSRSKDEP